MPLHITAAQYLEEYKMSVSFSNGRQGTADLSDALYGAIFEPLKDKAFFSRLKVDETLQTVVWPNGADLAPEYVFFKAFQDDPALRTQFEAWGYLGHSRMK
jgi:hypothetical protein